MNLNLNLGINSYSILIKKNSLESIGEKVRAVFSGEKVAIITDDNVDVFYGDIVKFSLEASGFKVEKFVLPHGEKTKSIEFAMGLYSQLLEKGISRRDLILTLGGGVIGDLGGFVASTYLRGVDFVQVPTTLLAQIDSSIGGKVGIDLKEGKNLVGSFYQPKGVIIDSVTLKTLPEKFFIDGMAEAIKYGAIFDENLFQMIADNSYSKDTLEVYNIDELIYKCCYWKKVVVEEDEREAGRRALLNFGHTFAHGIEKVQNYEGYSHGEAVAIGMCTITKGSEALGYTEPGTYKALKTLVDKIGLPSQFPEEMEQDVLEALWYDKKVVGSHINMILLNRIGKSFIRKMNQEEVREILSKGLSKDEQ